jgi:hypothetical protein
MEKRENGEKGALSELTILSLFISLSSNNTLSFVDNSPKNLRKGKL